MAYYGFYEIDKNCGKNWIPMLSGKFFLKATKRSNWQIYLNSMRII